MQAPKKRGLGVKSLGAADCRIEKVKFEQRFGGGQGVRTSQVRALLAEGTTEANILSEDYTSHV